MGKTQIKLAGDGAFLPGQALSLPLATARLPLAPAAIRLIAVVILITPKVRFDKDDMRKPLGAASPAAQLLSAGSGCHNGL